MLSGRVPTTKTVLTTRKRTESSVTIPGDSKDHVLRSLRLTLLRRKMDNMGRVLFGIYALSLVAVSYGQAGFSGPDTYPQFRDLSGLAGGGFGVSRDGYATYSGAYSLTTPIGYGLRSGEKVFGIGARSFDTKIRFLDTDSSQSNGTGGTGQAIYGFSTSFGRFTASTMVLSSRWDTVQHLQFNPNMGEENPLGFSLGVHNIAGRGQNAGENQPTDKKFSRSFYVAATYEYNRSVFVTVGKGERRYEGIFANATYAFSDQLKYMVEKDRYGINQMIYFATPAPFLINKGEAGKMFIGFGLLRGESAVWSLNFTF